MHVDHWPPARAVRIPGGMVIVGTSRPEIFADGEAPVRRVRIAPFSIDPHAVTNAWFGEFVHATGYLTEAERTGWSYVFHAFVASGAGDLGVEGAEWWRRVRGASWRCPAGPHSSCDPHHPVVHVSWDDARAFAAWAGGRLPTEAEWEHAARGGLEAARFPWGEADPTDAGPYPCNIWQGDFPHHDDGSDGFRGTAPVDGFAPNGYGLHNMVGNVWEWCEDRFRLRSLRRDLRSRDRSMSAEGRRLMKGGSYLCHRSYCYRYRIAARIGSPSDTSTGHLGFRVVWPL